jgi:hypothetical protein
MLYHVLSRAAGLHTALHCKHLIIVIVVKPLLEVINTREQAQNVDRNCDKGDLLCTLAQDI